MKQPWMIFQATKVSNPKALKQTFYLWNGSWAICIMDETGESIENIGWTGKEAKDISDAEIAYMDNIATNKRLKTFKLPRTGKTYKVLTRGTFPEEEV